MNLSRPAEGRKYINLQSGSAEKGSETNISQVKMFLKQEISKYSSMLRELEQKDGIPDEEAKSTRGSNDFMRGHQVSVGKGDSFGTKDTLKRVSSFDAGFKNLNYVAEVGK